MEVLSKINRIRYNCSMSLCCVKSLNRIIRAFQKLTNQPISQLEMVQALLGEMPDVTCVTLNRDRLRRIEGRLQTWRLMDFYVSLLYRDYEAKIREQIFKPFPRLNIHVYHRKYANHAKREGLIVVGVQGFEKRVYDYPKPTSLKRLL
jgi:hypothetical protein